MEDGRFRGAPDNILLHAASAENFTLVTTKKSLPFSGNGENEIASMGYRQSHHCFKQLWSARQIPCGFGILNITWNGNQLL